MKVTVIGLGPGGGADLTGRARAALEACDLIVGYTAYIDLVRADFPQKETLSTGMRREVDRCRAAVEAARTGKDVAVVCSGDSGVYGMAGLIYEVAQEYDPIEIEVVPGITAACGGAAVLGAPLTHDFAVVSLSDLLTPWEKITARLTAAAQADFVLCLRVRHRPQHRPGGGGGSAPHPGRAAGHPGGHVHHRVRRQQPDQGDRRKDGDPPGLSPAGGIGKYARRRRA